MSYQSDPIENHWAMMAAILNRLRQNGLSRQNLSSLDFREFGSTPNALVDEFTDVIVWMQRENLIVHRDFFGGGI